MADAPPPDGRPRVALRGICKHFGIGASRVDALADIALTVHAGETVGLRGPSGSGKSTLLNVIGCFTEPSSGWMQLNDEPVYDGHWLRSDLRQGNVATRQDEAAPRRPEVEQGRPHGAAQLPGRDRKGLPGGFGLGTRACHQRGSHPDGLDQESDHRPHFPRRRGQGGRVVGGREGQAWVGQRRGRHFSRLGGTEPGGGHLHLGSFVHSRQGQGL
ncbi:MAG TPA: ATP-binding cassette domain-containing protein [Acetobacteraceae bacterium]|nr:ATP-binding cassette domain-containing protein [Acetobacteraceae bacterium]